MAESIEWVNAGDRYARPQLTDDDFTDAYGQGVDEGNVGVHVGGVVVEGTEQELVAFAEAILDLFPIVCPECGIGFEEPDEGCDDCIVHPRKVSM